MKNYVSELEAIAPDNLFKMISDGNITKNCNIWELCNEIKPVDLYCYLYAKYGPPNGVMVKYSCSVS